MKIYRGAAAAARNYVEADSSRADDYYLAEGTGLADRYAATPDGVQPVGALSGDGYESWVAGYDPDTGTAKGRLRTDERGVRFVEVVVNGPKTWSLAAAVDPDIAKAYDAAQERAAEQIIGWLAGHVTTRVRVADGQVQIPVEAIEAVTVRHYTSRAGDPHRHLHLQVNARVFAAGKWRGLHTVAVRDSLDAINGIGHVAVITDPGFRTALAERGYTLDPESGEIVELAPYAGAFSARAAQIGRNIDSYEADWRTANPGCEPGPVLRQHWHTRAWAQARPDKVVPADGAELDARWVEELTSLGFTPPQPTTSRGVRAQRSPHPGSIRENVPGQVRGNVPGQVPPDERVSPAGAGESPAPDAVSARVTVGALDRDAAVELVLARLGARKSGWNAADIRGEVEQLIARTGLVATAEVRIELAEDLTARTLASCLPLLGDRRGVPEHIRALTSEGVVEVEADLSARLIARAEAAPAAPDHAVDKSVDRAVGSAGVRLDAGQQAVVAALAGGRALLVIEGAAGAGKTTTLAAARHAIGAQRRRLVVVTPTLKAAAVAARQLGTGAYSAAWLAHQHGYRWDDDGAWTRLHAGQTDPATGQTYQGPAPTAVMSPGDVLLCDEAGMLDQDTARALLTIADESGARVALIGDRHQLPAVGRGGVLDLVARWTHPDTCLQLEVVQRFTDPAYADLTLAMRTAHHPEEVFDALLARGDIALHATETERAQAIAETLAGDLIAAAKPARFRRGRATGGEEGRVLVVADTREQVAALNAATRDRLVAAGLVEDPHAVTTNAGERVGVGDRVATRRNDRDLDVANRETWTVTGTRPDGALTVTGERGERRLPARYVAEQVELAYASTVYGAQGDTVTTAHLLVGEHTGAAATYVGMTRGRGANTAHLVAETVENARSQWVAAFARDRADLGPAHAAQLAAAEADRYAPGRDADRVLIDLRQAWTAEQDARQVLTALVGRRDRLAAVVQVRAANQRQLAPLGEDAAQARRDAERARAQAGAAEAAVDVDTQRVTGAVLHQWGGEF
ncbi:MAG TPA: MobF family relaxase, partial [Mycobacteriales bacterium]|nr:MobF family relaxase [Mycobacteriales bacterium]